MNKPKAYSYIRWSSEKQTKGSSLERQVEAARKVAESKNLELVEMLDAGVSSFRGKNVKEGALGDFIDAVKAGAIPSGSYLILEAWDRATRQDLLTANQLLTTLLNLDIIIYTTVDNKEFSKAIIAENPFMLMMSLMELFRGHDESQKKSKRTNDSALIAINRFNNGERSTDGYALAIKAVGSHPWMFDTSESVLIGGKAYSTVKEHPKYWKVAQDIVSKISMGWGSYKLCEYLNENYEPPKQRKNKKREGWAINLLRNFHKQDYIRGIKKVTLKGVEHILDGYYPRLVDDETFFKLQNVRNRNKVTTTSRTYVGLISGIRVAKCGHCSDSISFFTNRKNRKNKVTGEPEQYKTLRYICTNKQVSTKNCASGSVDAQRIEDSIIRIGLAKIWNNDVQQDNSHLAELEAKKSQLIDLNAQQERIVDRMANFDDVPEVFDKKLSQIQLNINKCKTDIKDFENKASDNTNLPVSDIEKQWHSIPPNVLAKENDELRTKVRGMIRDAIDSITIWKLDGGERAGNKVEIKFKDGDLLSFDRTPTKLTLLEGFFDESSPETLFNRFKSLVAWNMDNSEYSSHSPKKIVRNLGLLGEAQFYPLTQPLE